MITRRTRPRRLGLLGLRRGLAAVCLVVLASCGRVIGSPTADQSPSPSSSAGQSASPARTVSPTPTQVASPSMTSFGAGDCTLTPSSSGGPTTRLRGGDYDFVVQEPAGWSQTTDLGSTETKLIRFTAPSTYSNSPTTIELWSLLGKFSSARVGAQQNFANDPGVGAIADCQVAGEQAAFFQSTEGGQPVYRIFLLHHELLYMVTLKGTGGFDLHSITDTKTLLGSWSWLN